MTDALYYANITDGKNIKVHTSNQLLSYMTSYLTKFYRNIICNDLSFVKNDSCLYDAASHLYYIIIWGKFVPYNHDMTLYLLLYVVYLRINLDHPKLSNSAAKKLLVLCSTTFICQCTLIVSLAGKLGMYFRRERDWNILWCFCSF